MPTYLTADLSPDGDWLASAVMIGNVEQTRIHLSELATGRAIILDNARPLSWSPDSRHLLFSSNADGGGRLWIFDRDTGRSRDLGLASPFGSGGPAWLPDGRHVVAKADTRRGDLRSASRPSRNPFVLDFPERPPAALSVHVYRANPTAESQGPERQPLPGAEPCGRLQSFRSRCDLVLIDTVSGAVTRLVADEVIGNFIRPSPDGRSVAYTVFRGRSDSQLYLYDLRSIDLRSGENRLLAANAPLSSDFGNWSPNGDSIIFPILRSAAQDSANRFAQAPADVGVISTNGAGLRLLSTPNLQAAFGRERWRWNPAGTGLLLRDIRQTLWEVDVRSGDARRLGGLGARRIKVIIAPNEPEIAATVGRRELLFVTAAATSDGQADEILAIDLRRERVARALRPGMNIVGAADASAERGLVLLRLQAPFRPVRPSLWRVDDLVATPLPPIDGLDDSNLAQVRRIRWRRNDGIELSGDLFLPPNYHSGERLPLVVEVYGGDSGLGRAANPTIAMTGHMLASRGYAVFFPDAPERVGHPAEDLFRAVMPGVDKLIAEGLVDPERMAIMGNSYGSISALRVITNTQRFRAAILSAVIHPDLLAQYLEMNAEGEGHVRNLEHGQGLMGVSPWADPERYRANSPIHGFDRILTPVLMAHGSRDPASLLGPGAVYVALRRLGISVEYRLYGGEGHGIDRAANAIDWWNRRLSFLAEHLDVALDAQGRVIIDGGRARPRTPAGPSGSASGQ